MINLVYLIQSFRLSLGITSTQYDQQFLQWAINGIGKLNELGLYPTATKSVKLPVVNHRTNLPQDYKAYVRIGLCCNGQILNFDKNDGLCLPYESGCDCGTSEQITQGQEACGCTVGGGGATNCGEGNQDGWWQWPIFGQPYSWSYTMGSYGVGPGYYHGGYKIDLHTNQILFDSCVTAHEIVLEYEGDFLNDMGNCLIPNTFFYKECINIWMDSERKYWSPDERLQRKYKEAKNRWYQVVRDINSKQQSMNSAEWLQLFRAFCFQGVKA